MMFAIFMFLAFLSYLFAGQADQSLVSDSGVPLRTKGGETQNLLGYSGAVMSHYMIFRWFGLAALLFPPFLFIWGYRLSFKKSLISLSRYALFSLFFLVWLGLLLGYLVHLIDGVSYLAFLSGGFGYELALIADELLGWGTFILIFGSLLIFVIVFFNVDQISWFGDSESATVAGEEEESDSHFLRDKVQENPADPADLAPAEEEEASENSWKLSEKEKPAPQKANTDSPAFNIEDRTQVTESREEEADDNFFVAPQQGRKKRPIPW